MVVLLMNEKRKWTVVIMRAFEKLEFTSCVYSGFYQLLLFDVFLKKEKKNLKVVLDEIYKNFDLILCG